MSESNLVFSKIVAFPKPSSWSQAYNAGKLFTTISLKTDSNKEQEPSDMLSVAGKRVLDKLEEEFFTIETKTLESIKQAIGTTLKEIPDGISSSFTAVVIVDNILYSFTKGGGKVFLKRNDKFGTILEAKEEDQKNVVSSSGELEDNDLITLVSRPFLDIIDPTTLSASLNSLNPHEITETLTPKVLEKDEGGAAAFIIKYTKQAPQVAVPSTVLEEQQEVKKTEEFKTQLHISFLKKYLPIQANILTHTKKKFLTIAVVILIILGLSIFFAIKKQNDIKNKELFEEVYESALKKYDEGSSLLDLNKSLAKESLSVSQKLLQENKDKFLEKSQEKEKVEDLLKKVNEKLSTITSVGNLEDKRKTLSVAVKNGSGVTGAAAKAGDFLKSLGYNVVSTVNADKDDYKDTKIQVKSNKKEFLDLLKNDLSKNYTIGETSSDLPDTSPEDTLVIIGK